MGARGRGDGRRGAKCRYETRVETRTSRAASRPQTRRRGMARAKRAARPNAARDDAARAEGLRGFSGCNHGNVASPGRSPSDWPVPRFSLCAPSLGHGHVEIRHGCHVAGAIIIRGVSQSRLDAASAMADAVRRATCKDSSGNSTAVPGNADLPGSEVDQIGESSISGVDAGMTRHALSISRLYRAPFPEENINFSLIFTFVSVELSLSLSLSLHSAGKLHFSTNAP